MSHTSDPLEPGQLLAGRAPHEDAKPRRTRQDSQIEKRAAILRAAQVVFERSGYDGASMNDICAEAAVSKPTLYVYFDSKEKLFDALIEAVCTVVPESVLELDPSDPNIAAQLERCGVGLMLKIARPEHMDMLRVLIGAAGKFPQLGQKFYAAGPGRGVEKFKAYLHAVAQRGWLVVPDPDLAAIQLLELIKCGHMHQMLYAAAAPPSRQQIERTVHSGIAMFLSAHRPAA